MVRLHRPLKLGIPKIAGPLIAAIALLITIHAFAWGPVTRKALVSTVAGVLAKDLNLPLAKIQKEVLQGATLSPAELSELYPDFAVDPAAAIESEIYLLQAVRGAKIDPYFAFRLGTLGALVAALTAPLREAGATARAQYYADVDLKINGIQMRMMPRQLVDPKTYFPRLLRAITANDAAIERDYAVGTGFEGTARATLPETASLSAAAIADVWYTVLTSSRAGAASDEQRRRYAVRALTFYIERGNPAEIDAALDRYTAAAPFTADTYVQVADSFYAAGMMERAVALYKKALELDNTRRDVVSKISGYYVQQGDNALTSGALERALEAYQTASELDPLHPEAESKRLQVEQLIKQRDERLAANQAALEHGAQLRTLAEQESTRGRYAEAIALLREALEVYNEVSDEFPVEATQRTRAVREIQAQIDSLRETLLANAQMLSGSGSDLDMVELLREKAKQFDRDALRLLLRSAYQEEVADLEASLLPRLESSAP